jgi:O-antigen/teichoic acid export membrane protein
VRHIWSPAFGIGYIFLSQVIANAATLLFLTPQVRVILKGQFVPELWFRMLRYSAPLILVSMAGIVNETLDRAILTYLLPGTPEENLAQVGIYGANYKLTMMITLFTQAYRYAAEPFFFRNASHKDALQIQADAAKWYTIAASAGMLGILLFIDLAKYFIGAKFRSGLGVVPILLLANVLLGLYYNFSVWYRLKDKTQVGAWISIGGAVITIVLNVVFAPVYGYMASAWATLACYAFMSWITWYIGRKEYPVPYRLRQMGFYLVLALVLYGVSELFRGLLADHEVMIWIVNIALYAAFLGIVAKLEDLRQFIRKSPVSS